jgi:glycosyltransferase involved in cell wall biosynthesis
MKIAYVLGSRFPTPKAYGVTCRETVTALVRNMNEVHIFGYASDYSDSDFENIKDRYSPINTSKLTKLLRDLGNRGVSLFQRFCWKMSLVTDIKANIENFKAFNPDFYWTRNPEISLLILEKIPGSKVVLEIHFRNRLIDSRKFLRFEKRIILAPINLGLKNYVHNFYPDVSLVVAPMSINSENVVSESQVVNFVKSLNGSKLHNLKIAYVGKFAPGGFSKGVEDLIMLAELYEKLNLKHQVFLIGGEPDDLLNLSPSSKIQLENCKNLFIIPHLSHTEANRLMKSMDVLVLPAPKSEKYEGTPIKSLEYCSAGKIIVAADSITYRQAFEENFTPFWYLPGSPHSLFESIQNSIWDPNLVSRILDGVTLASKFTWEKRTQSILEAFTEL